MKHTKHKSTVFHRFSRLSPLGKLITCVVIIAILLILFPHLLPGDILHRGGGTGAAKFYFVSPSKDLTEGQTFTVELHSSSGTPINAVGTTLTFNPRILEVLNMTTEKSFCSFYLDNSFDTIKGEVHLSCGAPNPGFTGDSTIAVLSMRSKTTGTSEIKMVPADSQILANDGRGTNLLKDYPSLTLTIKQTF